MGGGKSSKKRRRDDNQNRICVFLFRGGGELGGRGNWQERTIYHHRGAQTLADPAKAMVDMIFLCFPGFGYLP